MFFGWIDHAALVACAHIHGRTKTTVVVGEPWPAGTSCPVLLDKWIDIGKLLNDKEAIYYSSKQSEVIFLVSVRP